MHNYNAKEDLDKNYEIYKEVYNENIKYICDNNGDTLSEQDKNILIAGYLHNMHKTLSTVSSNLCHLSKSTYEASVYINEIREYQRIATENIVKDDILMYLEAPPTPLYKLALIRDYIAKLGD